MKITSVKVSLVNNGRLRGYASFIIDECFLVRDVRLIQGDDRLFLAMPAKKSTRGDEERFIEIAHPINAETRQELEDAIFDEYKRQVAISTESVGRA